MNKSWIVTVEEDLETGDMLLPIPEELLQMYNLVIGDTINYGVNTETGQVTLNFVKSEMTADKLVIGNYYNWKHSPDSRLVYLGKVLGGWYQFKKIDNPREVLCEVRECDLRMFEEIK